MKTICILGLGYIGLPTASMFATHGFHVIGVDIRQQVVDTLNNGDVHIQEPGLKTLVQAALHSGNLIVRAQPEHADVFIIAVPTPFVHANGNQDEVKHADLSYVQAAAESIAACLAPGNLVVLESTSPPGTTADTVVPILARSGFEIGKEIFVAYCPERVLPGQILRELVSNDRVMGGINRASAEMARELYRAFVEGEILLTDATTAEMVKLMENTFRDVNIALANEFARVAEHLGINVWEAIEIANHHPRVKILKPGPGVGGHCIAVDPWFIAEAAPDVTPLIQTARRVNDAMPGHVVELVKQAVSGIEQPVIACLGLTYKADVDDTRESPAMEVVELLCTAGLNVRAFDPNVTATVIPSQVHCLDDALRDADALVVLVGHREFKEMDSAFDISLVRGRLVLDVCNVLKVEEWERAGFSVSKLGSGGVTGKK